MAVFTQKEQLQLEELTSMSTALNMGGQHMPRWQRKALAAKKAVESNKTPVKGGAKTPSRAKTPGVSGVARDDHANSDTSVTTRCCAGC